MFYVLDPFYETRFSSSSSLLRESEECAINELETFRSKIEAHYEKSVLVISFHFLVCYVEIGPCTVLCLST